MTLYETYDQVAARLVASGLCSDMTFTVSHDDNLQGAVELAGGWTVWAVLLSREEVEDGHADTNLAQSRLNALSEGHSIEAINKHLRYSGVNRAWYFEEPFNSSRRSLPCDMKGQEYAAQNVMERDEMEKRAAGILNREFGRPGAPRGPKDIGDGVALTSCAHPEAPGPMADREISADSAITMEAPSALAAAIERHRQLDAVWAARCGKADPLTDLSRGADLDCLWQQLRAIDEIVHYFYPNAGKFGPEAVQHEPAAVLRGCVEKATSINVFLNREACLIAERRATAEPPAAEPREKPKAAGDRW